MTVKARESKAAGMLRGLNKERGRLGRAACFYVAVWLYVILHSVVVLGQSMGASLAINFVAAAQDKYQIDALFAEAPFRGFPAVARSALSSNILGWLVWPFTVLVPSRWDPQNVVQDIHVPVMIMSSPDDQIVPHKQSRQLYEMLTERSGNIPSCWVESHGPHIASFNDKRLRRKALKFIRSQRCPALSGT